MKLSDPVSLDLTLRFWVYRFWNENGDCLYVGQHTGIHPATRIQSHRNQPWWNEVTGADYVEVLEGDLDIVEKQQIHDLNALYNDGGWRRLHPSDAVWSPWSPPRPGEVQHEQQSPRREQAIAHLVQRNKFRTRPGGPISRTRGPLSTQGNPNHDERGRFSTAQRQARESSREEHLPAEGVMP